jgi:hypothetical protein
MRLLTLLALILVPSFAPAAAPPHVASGDTPRDGVHRIEPQQLWQRGHEDDDLIFGAVGSVQRGPDGNVYVMDQQLSQVFVFTPDGDLLRTLSREGEGPGETRRPEHMVFLPDGSLGLAQYINGRIVRIDLEGTPLGTMMPPGAAGDGGGLANIRRVRCRGGSFVVNGVTNTPQGEEMVRRQYLVRCDDEGRPLVEYLASSSTNNVMRDGWIEKNNWFPSHELWDIDDEGNVLAAADRNEYRIAVYAPDGSVLRTFGRQEAGWRRSDERKQEIRDSVTVIADGQRVRIDVTVEDIDPVIVELHAMPGGETWVLTSRGRQERPEGVMMTWDVFDRAGAFVRREEIACAGDPMEDRLYFLGEGRAALVRGAVQARRNTFGGRQGDSIPPEAVHDLLMLGW